MDSSALQSFEIDSVSSPNPPSLASVPDDEIQTLTNSPTNSEEPKQISHTQNPSSSPADSDTLQIVHLQAPDPLNSVPVNSDHEDPDDQEGMSLSPSHNVDEERLVSPPSRSVRRPPRRGRKVKKMKLLSLEKRSETLAMEMKSIPFVPNKALDFLKHEESLRKLGLWDFAHLEFDSRIRNDLVAKLVINYSDKNRSSYIDDVRLLVNPTYLARALSLPCKKMADCGEMNWPVDFISFVDDFVSSWMLLHEDTWMLPSEVMNWTGMIREGHPEKVDWARLMWFMVKRELLKGSQLLNCYYASHLQQLIKYQKEALLKDDDDVKTLENDEVSHGEETEMKVENAPANVEEGDHVKNLNILVTAVDQVENLETASVGHVENLATVVDHVENLKPAGVDHVENLEMAAADHGENLELAPVDHVENLKPAMVDHVENLETAAVNHVENLEKAVVDHVENLKPAVVDHVENLEMAAADHVEHLEIGGHAEHTGDLVKNLEYAGDHVETTGDPVENLKSTALAHVKYLQLLGEEEENTEPTNDVEDMNIDGEDNNKQTVNAMEDVKTEAEIVIPDDDDAEIQETGCNDLIDFEVCKVEEHNPWDLSSKDPEQQHFLQHCTMSEPELHEHQENNTHLPEELDDDDDDEEDGEPAQGFSLSNTHLINSMDSSQIPYFGGQSSIFGSSSKRELDLDPEISTHKRMRTEPPELEVCFDQIQQWIEKSKHAYLTTQQTAMSQQQMLFNELGSKEHLIQQLKMQNDELQRRRQAEISRYENELYTMNNVIYGYRKALKSTLKTFAEYRKRSPLPIEPLYKDAGEGGVVKSVAELERERLKREEKEKAARIMVESFEKEWEIKFEGLMEETEKLEARICEIVKGVELIREMMEKKKGSELVS